MQTPYSQNHKKRAFLLQKSVLKAIPPNLWDDCVLLFNKKDDIRVRLVLAKNEICTDVLIFLRSRLEKKSELPGKYDEISYSKNIFIYSFAIGLLIGSMIVAMGYIELIPYLFIAVLFIGPGTVWALWRFRLNARKNIQAKGVALGANFLCFFGLLLYLVIDKLIECIKIIREGN